MNTPTRQQRVAADARDDDNNSSPVAPHASSNRGRSLVRGRNQQPRRTSRSESAMSTAAPVAEHPVSAYTAGEASSSLETESAPGRREGAQPPPAEVAAGTACGASSPESSSDGANKRKRSEESDGEAPASPATSCYSSEDMQDDGDDGESACLKRSPKRQATTSAEATASAAATSTPSAETAETAAELPVLKPGVKKTVLVTGGAGFIGSHTAEHLLARGDDVVIVDEVNDYYDPTLKRRNLALLAERYGAERVRFYEGDICEVAFIERVFAENPAMKHIVHLAARAGVRPSIDDPFVYVHSNVEATTRLLELARRNGNESFVFASSSSVYGGSTKESFSEADCVDFPVSPYAASKKATELLAYTYHHLYKLNCTGLRFFTVYGPRGRPDMAPFKFVDRVSRGVEIQQYGDGSTSRDYTYIDDIVDGVVRSLDRPAGYRIYNLGNGTPTALSTFIGMVQEFTGVKANIRVMPEQPGDVPRTCADITRARTLLGYAPKTPFREGLRKTVDWYRTAYGESAARDLLAARELKGAAAPAAPSSSVVA